MKPRIGVVGAWRGRGFVSVLSAMPDCQLVAVCDKDPQRLQPVVAAYPGLKGFESYTAMLDSGLDLVVVATPPMTHVALAVEAMERGIGVISEVPAAHTLEECWQLLAAVRRTGAFYGFAENMNYFAYFEAWKRIIDSGQLGRIVYAEAEYNHDCRPLCVDASGRPTWRAAYPPIHYCTHSLGPLLWLAQDRVVRVTGFRTEIQTAPELGNTDIELGLMQTAKGALLKIMCAFTINREPAFHYHSIYGTKGCLETSRRRGKPHLAYLADIPHLHDMIEMPIDTTHRGLPPEATKGGHGTAEWVMLRQMLDAWHRGSRPPLDVYDALDMTAPGILAHQSALSGNRPLEVPDFRTAAERR